MEKNYTDSWSSDDDGDDDDNTSQHSFTETTPHAGIGGCILDID